ncbi:LuxR family transcriptional regulator [Actinoallomurus vinaceus]|uniref:LuxR family transcriptional regulator n=1 Tax=Actinoallomurus vinaceus TaxID=1080074 RepID=A0ABP8U5H8_9ACTN
MTCAEGRTPRSRKGNLPADVTSFVGRRDLLAEVRRLLSRSRLVTLTGVGGVGKTRLALRAASDLDRSFTDGAWLVQLAGLEDPELVALTAAVTVGACDHSTRQPLASLTQYLEDRRLLLVLDNCEHLHATCASVVDDLLRQCPGVQVLATSRQSLGIAGEYILTVPPMSVPPPDQEPQAADLTQSEAVALFLDRAEAVVNDFAADTRSHVTAARICRRLDGIPLAIELAAVRLRALSAQQILDRLTNRFELLTSGYRTAMPRQQTLRALIDWSHALCSVPEQTLWARLSVFAERFDIEAVVAVCADETLPPETLHDLLSALVDKSIVAREPYGDEVRFVLLETLREYGQERLAESGELPMLRRRHRDWYQRIAERAEREWFGPAQLEWLARLRSDLANLRSALNFSLTEAGEVAAGLTIAAALRFYWVGGGLFHEGRHWLGRLLAADTTPGSIRVRGLYVDAYLALLLSDRAAAIGRMREVDTLVRELGGGSLPEADTGYIAQVLGLIALFGGDPTGAAPLCEQALVHHQVAGDEAGVIHDKIELGQALSLLDEHDRARELYEECLAECAASGERWLRCLGLYALAIALSRQGEHRRAVAAAQESVLLKRPFNDAVVSGLAVEVMAWSTVADGRVERGARLLGAAEAILRAIGARLSTFGHLVAEHEMAAAMARRVLGDTAYDTAFREGAERTMEEALDYALEVAADRRGAQGRARPVTRSAAGPSHADDVSPSGPVPGAHLGDTVPGPAATVGALTRRERQIAELVATGMRNRDIAAELVIATRTAEGHIQNILKKLGFTSRSQIAAWVTAQRQDAADRPQDETRP